MEPVVSLVIPFSLGISWSTLKRVLKARTVYYRQTESFKRKFLFLVRPKSRKGVPCEIVLSCLVLFLISSGWLPSKLMVAGEFFSFDQNCQRSQEHGEDAHCFIFALYPLITWLWRKTLSGMLGQVGKLKLQFFF